MNVFTGSAISYDGLQHRRAIRFFVLSFFLIFFILTRLLVSLLFFCYDLSSNTRSGCVQV